MSYRSFITMAESEELTVALPAYRATLVCDSRQFVSGVSAASLSNGQMASTECVASLTSLCLSGGT